eukprot:TRINITY_DN117307_c0_g1_i1.p1 TRINITY_DN117307_c0_g1~~TRINITY_DN117307_c0_g1_i1.p1  ORF type:complete len:251 (-),score=56.69 TRINITY_DN117307_c0_g1_i1:43-744(-)
MALATALDSLGAAIRDEVKREVTLVRQELEQERQLRQLLEQQVHRLKQGIYTSTEVDQIAEGLKTRMDAGMAEMLESAGKDWKQQLRELEHRFQVKLEELNSSSPAAPASRSEDSQPQLLTMEIDRKLGSALLDLDQRYAQTHADQIEASEAAAQKVALQAEEARRDLEARIDEISTFTEAGLHELRNALQALAGLECNVAAQISSVETGLKEKIGMVQLDVDQLRKEVLGGA